MVVVEHQMKVKPGTWKDDAIGDIPFDEQQPQIPKKIILDLPITNTVGNNGNGSKKEIFMKEKTFRSAIMYCLCIFSAILVALFILVGIHFLKADGSSDNDYGTYQEVEGTTIQPATTTTITEPTESPIGKTKAPAFPTSSPTMVTARPTDPPMENSPTASPLPPNTARLYVIGDIPYKPEERLRLRRIVKNMPYDAEFLIHVGDIRNATEDTHCNLTEYQDVRDILLQSPVPVFVVPGGEFFF